MRQLQSNVETLNISLDAAQKSFKTNIYIPPGYSDNLRYPVFYLFHGNGSSSDAVVEGLKIENITNKLITSRDIVETIIVMPSWQEADVEPLKYLDFIKELISLIDNKYNTIQERSSRYIGGFSLGGQLAYSVHFQDASLFSRIGGHMPALKKEGWKFSVDYPQTNPFELVEELDVSSTEFYLDCGKNDEHKLYIGCEQMYNILREKKADVQNDLNEGAHTNKYLYENIESYLKFYLREG